MRCNLNLKLILIAVLFLLGINVLSAQDIPQIKLKTTEQDRDMQLSQLSIRVNVVGNIATTEYDMIFHNPIERTLEGQLNFPLEQGQSVSGFAMDVEGKLREGVVVEKAKGRKTFESIVRKGVDPGLLEQTQGNNFRMRIFPIPPFGNKHIVLRYQEELEAENGSLIYNLPLMYPNSIPEFSIAIEVVDPAAKPEILMGAGMDLHFKNQEKGYYANYTEKGFTPQGNIRFRLPNPMKKELNFTQEDQGTTYFYLNLPLQSGTVQKSLPKSVCLYWDNSGSMENAEKEKILDLLDYYFKQFRRLQVTVVPFAHKPLPGRSYTLKAGQWDDLRNYLNHLQPDGGTQLGLIDLNLAKCDEILLCSDGLSNFGKKEPQLPKVPMTIINSNAAADHSYLNFIAMSTHGKYINVRKKALEEAKQQLLTESFQFISADFDSSEIAELFPKLPCPVGEHPGFAGILKSDSAQITLNFGYGNKVTVSKKVIIRKSDTPSNKVMRIWAQKKINELAYRFDQNREQITQLAKEHGIVTRNTSLIVLETLWDYVQYEIVPPKEMREQYYALLERHRKEKAAIKVDTYGFLKRQANQLFAWWDTDFDPSKKPIRPPKFIRPHRENDTIELEEEMVPVTRQEQTPPPPPDVFVDELEIVETEAEMEEVVEVVSEEEEQDDVSAFCRVIPSTTAQRGFGNIKVNAWDSGASYLDSLRNAPKGKAFATYLRLRPQYSQTPSFFLEAGNFFHEIGQRDDAIQVWSNIAEMQLENAELLRILANRLMEIGESDLALQFFQDILKMREEEPQSYRDLALAYEAVGEYQKALDQLYDLLLKERENRFHGIRPVILNEMNALISRHGKQLNLTGIDQQFIKAMPLDIRIVVSWSSNDCDIDLWVTDPRGEKCFYQNQLTQIGGKISNDMTQGYGPEEFCLKKAIKGKYKIQANYYSNHRQSLSGPVTIQTRIFTHYGTPQQKEQVLTVQVKEIKQVIDLGEIEF